MMFSRWWKLLNPNSRPAKRARGKSLPQKRNAHRLTVEQLEDRLLLSAAVWTNKPDYLPGETVSITGQEFLAGETVQLQVLHADGQPDLDAGHEPWQVVVRSDGFFQTSWIVTPDSYDSTLQLTATGLSSGFTAATTFTDGFGLSKLLQGSSGPE